MRRKRNNLLFALALLVLVAIAGAAEKPPRADLNVTGLGWQDSRLARGTLRALLGDKPRPTVDANVIEDAALILFAQEAERGYLKPAISAEVVLTDGTKATYPLDAQLDHSLPRPLEATAVTLKVERGQRYLLQEVRFSGLQALTEEVARAFFIGDPVLISSAGDRIYSPGRLERSAGSLEAQLHLQGYTEAAVTTDQLEIDDATGETKVRVVVNEGNRWRVTHVNFEIDGGAEAPPGLAAKHVGQAWSATWRQDMLTEVRRWYFEQGFPDVQVRLTPSAAPPQDRQREVSVTVGIDRGPQVRVGAVSFTGNTHTRESALRRLVPVETGEMFNPVKFDDGLSRISRLGVFSHVALAAHAQPGDIRDVEYQLKEGKRQEVNLLAGYGSYEQLRGGIEWRHYNIMGRAHSDNLKLIQSMKSTQGSYTYSIPELFGTEVDGSARLFGLRREELAFLREEYGGTVSLHWPLPAWGAGLTTGYTYQNLRNDDNELATQAVDDSETKAASIDIDLVKDKRDNPLQPQKGYKAALRIEAAAKVLGGETIYQQIVLAGSWHKPWGKTRWFHVALAHGVVTTLGAPDGSNPPVNVLFYPGGDGSIRGYQDDEAAPRDPVTGDFIGAKTYTQLNLELEQAITRKWVVVAFVDAVGTATRLEDYPFSETLYSAGLGIRYNTVIGPLRLEYGHNLNPRPQDPDGTLHFSVGYPF